MLDAVLTLMTVLGVALVGIGSFLHHNGRAGHRVVGQAEEVAGAATIGLGWVIDYVRGPLDCYAPDSGCPETFAGFVWYVVGDPAVEALWATAAFLVGWALGARSPWRGTGARPPLFEPTFPASERRTPSGTEGSAAPRDRPVRIRSEPAPPGVSPPTVWVRVSLNGKVAHLLGPERRSACGRLLKGYSDADDETRPCQTCQRRSATGELGQR